MTAHVLWIGTTLGIFFLSRAVYLRFGHASLHPVLWSTVCLIGLLLASQYRITAFKQATSPLVWLLGPAVVAMALPVWQRRALIVEHWLMFAIIIGISLLVAVGTSHFLPPLLGLDMSRALAVKSVTAPVALGIGAQIGLRQDFVVVGVMTSGLFGMLLGPVLLASGGLRGDSPAVGAALGCASHGLGTARAYEIGTTAGAFASVSMGLSALAYGVILPFLLS